MPAAVPPADALEMLARMREVPGHEFLIDDVPLVLGSLVPLDRVGSYRQVMDAHLVAVARRHGARLATLDRGIAALAGGRDVVIVGTS